MENKPIVYKLEHWALGKLSDLIEAYNKRARQLEQRPIKFKVETKTRIGRPDTATGPASGTDEQWTEKYLEVTFEGDPLRINGWEFIGTIQHAETGNLLRSVPGSQIPEMFRHVKPHCEHCAKYRARKDTFVLHKMSEDKIADRAGLEQLNVYKQIGRNCLRDFLGHDPDMQLRLLDAVFELQGGEGRGSWKQAVTVDEALEMNAAVAIEIGFAKGSPYTAWQYLFKDSDTREKIRKGEMKDVVVTDEARKLANRAKWHVLDQAEPNDFIRNIQAVLRLPMITRREINLAGWAVGAYLKEMERDKLTQTRAQIRREQTLKNKEIFGNSAHVGQEGQRLEAEIKLIQERKVGTTALGQQLTLYKFLTREGNVLTWITSSPWTMGEADQQFVGARFTVRGHSEYEGIKETRVNRVSPSGTPRSESTIPESSQKVT